MNVKTLRFRHELTANDTSKTAKITKKVIVLKSTLTFRRRGAWWVLSLFVIFVVLDVSHHHSVVHKQCSLLRL